LNQLKEKLTSSTSKSHRR